MSTAAALLQFERCLQESDFTISCSPVSSTLSGCIWHALGQLNATLCFSSESHGLPRLLCTMQTRLSMSSPLIASGLHEANTPGSHPALLFRV